ncbi:MAG: hypothetical protein M3O50_00965, partial [Myxococcota bacterium]|nr:hypothetical protein [Myxococcota bacterium]
MANSPGQNLLLGSVLLAAATTFASAPVGCTAATPDVPVAASGSAASGSNGSVDASTSSGTSTS